MRPGAQGTGLVASSVCHCAIGTVVITIANLPAVAGFFHPLCQVGTRGGCPSHSVLVWPTQVWLAIVAEIIWSSSFCGPSTDIFGHYELNFPMEPIPGDHFKFFMSTSVIWERFKLSLSMLILVGVSDHPTANAMQLIPKSKALYP